MAGQSYVPELLIVQVVPWLILDLIDVSSELTASKLGADPAARLELGRLFHQLTFVIEHKRITAGQNCLRRECLQTAM